jgi:CubicO group peptidase (beta-lactamase class C family)
MCNTKRRPATAEPPARSGRIAVLLTVALVLGAAPGQAGAQAWEGAARVDSVFAQWDRSDSPGCAVGAIERGELVHSRGYGSANLDYGIPLSSRSVFYLASASKQFTAAAILLAEDEGYLSLDDEVQRWIPELPDYGPSITVRHLVHHTSGLRDYLTLMSLAGRPYGDAFGDEAMLGLITRQRALNFEPGSEYLYTNTGYVLLAEIVKRATGRSLREYAEERIFAPLGMTSSHFHDDARQVVPGRVISYGSAGGGGFRVSYLSQFDRVGDGGMYSTVEDLARWVDALHRDRVGSPGFAARLEARGALANGEALGYAFGQSHGSFRGVREIGHGGSMMDFRTTIRRFPGEEAAVIVLCNIGSANPQALGGAVAEVVLGDRLAPVPERAGAGATGGAQAGAPGADPEPEPLSPEEAEAFTGVYHSPELEVGYRVERAEDGPDLTLVRAGGQRTPLQWLDQGDVFTTRGLTLRFQRDAEGRVEGFLLDAGRVRGIQFRR